MARMRCCKCGSENLKDEYFFVACKDCGNVTYTIPGDAVIRIENPVAPDNVNPIVAMLFDRSKLGERGLSICEDDSDGEPCNIQGAREMTEGCN